MEAYNISLYSLAYLNKDIDISANLLNKTWRVFNDSDVKETCIFNEDGSLTIVIDGIETTSSWEHNIANNSIVVDENILTPSYKDNIFFVFHIQGKGNVFLIDESNELSFIPINKQEIYDYFQEAEPSYYRLLHYTRNSKITGKFVYLLLFLQITWILLFILLFYFFKINVADFIFGYTFLGSRILVEFGIDNPNSLINLVIGISLFILGGCVLFWPFSLMDFFLSKGVSLSCEDWINKHSDNEWKKYGHNLYVFMKKTGRLNFSTLDSLNDFRSEHISNLIGFPDDRIKTRDQLLKIDKEIRELRASLFENTKPLIQIKNKLIIGFFVLIISIIMCLTVVNVTKVNLFVGIYLISAFIFLIGFFFYRFCCYVLLPYSQYKRDSHIINKWIISNPNDWRKDYVNYRNYVDYKIWMGL